MTHRRSLIVLAFALVLSGLAATRPSEVSACSLAPPEPETRVRDFTASATAVVVGEVVAEDDDITPRGYEGHKSTVQVVAKLAGDVPDELVLEDLGQLGADCSGGPRLMEGDGFILFLSTEKAAPGRNHLPEGEWRVALVGQAVYQIEEGEASWYQGFDVPPGTEPIGPAEDLLRQVGDALGSDEEQVERAIAYANGDLAPLRAVPPAQTGPNPVATWGAVAIALIASAIAVGWVLRSRRARSVRGEERA